ncbi:MAG: tail fiber domain-containing protein [Pseudomonadota bacterium]
MKLTIKHAMLSMLIFFSAGTAADTLKYAGEIADDAGIPLNGEYLMTFSLYDNPQGYIIWEETQNVIVQDGHYEVVLGTNNPINFPADKEYYLEITLGGSPELAAQDVITPTGKKPKKFNKPVLIKDWLLVGSTSYTPSAKLEVNPDAIEDNGDEFVVDNDGNVGIGTMSPGAKLDVDGTIKASYIKLPDTDTDGANSIGSNTYDGNQSLRINGEKNIFLIINEQSEYPDAALEVRENSPSYHLLFKVKTNGEAYHSGNVGIGTTSPSYKLHVNGTAYATGAAGALSDRRHKENISDLPIDALKVVKELRPVIFEWKEPQDNGMEGSQIGFIAQEVEKVLPEAVLTQDNEEQTKGLKYNALIPVLTKAVQTLAEENETLKSENAALKRDIAQIKAALGL